jgi:undecaprenyl diphosphate synthase
METNGVKMSDSESQKNIPKHIAIVMDGNGRWAKNKGLPRTAGHKKGVKTTQNIVKYAGEISVQYLTLFAFSTENWKRPENEIMDLMGLLRHYMKGEAAELIKNNVCLNVIGFRNNLSLDILRVIESLEEQSQSNNGLKLTIALDYGGRQEILNAVNAVIADGKKELNMGEFQSYLWTGGLPDPDLVIRTSGEQRISNFLLWQSAYSEFVFSQQYWPDFTIDDFDQAIIEFQNRERRFGHSESQVSI